MDEKKITRNLVNFAFKDIIDEELEKKSLNEAMEAYFEEEGEKLMKKSEFATEYLINNRPEACNSCDYSFCFLEKDYECGRIGIKIEDIFSKDKTSIYKIKEISKYKWLDVGDCLIPIAF